MHFIWTAFGVAFVAPLTLLPPSSLAGNSGASVSFTRSGSDQLESASLASGEALSFSYDASYGQMTEIAGSAESGFNLELASDTLLHLPLSQTVTEDGNVLLSTAIIYDAGGLRASRIVSAGSEGKGSSTTNYWYGGSLHPLVVTREGVDYRMIGKAVVEAIGWSGVTRSYLLADRLGSVRVVADDQGHVMQSLGYDGDYGATRIQGQSYASADDDMASFYRFQGQEQEVFPLAKLGIEDDALARWLDQIQLYHFPWRDYAAGLAVFTQTDPIPTEASLYSAFAANPVNFTDETGGMIGDEATNDDHHIDNLLERVLEDSAANFDERDRNLLGQRLNMVQTGVQTLVARSEALAVRIANMNQQLRQTEIDLQQAREQQALFHTIDLISEQWRLGRVQRMPDTERQQYFAVVRYAAEDISHRRTSPLERRLSDRYLQLQQLDDALQGEWQTIIAEMQDLENWLDIYQAPIVRLLDPDEAEDDDDEDEYFDLPEGSPVSSEPRSEDDNAEHGAPPRHDGNGSNLQRDRSQEDRERGDRSDDEI